MVFTCFFRILFFTPSHVVLRIRIFGLAQTQKMDDITFCRNNLVWFGLWREVVVSLQWHLTAVGY